MLQPKVLQQSQGRRAAEGASPSAAPKILRRNKFHAHAFPLQSGLVLPWAESQTKSEPRSQQLAQEMFRSKWGMHPSAHRSALSPHPTHTPAPSWAPGTLCPLLRAQKFETFFGYHSATSQRQLELLCCWQLECAQAWSSGPTRRHLCAPPSPYPPPSSPPQCRAL